MNSEEGFINFLCPSCKTEIEASPDMVGHETECPACGAKMVIPAPGEGGVVRHGLSDPGYEQGGPYKSRTIRIELGDL
ncbi:MAG: hypothetical protein IJI73_05480 [Kiritimatiellae bacterium]|nr:hypothetical protein [Kiritimatiellia bacterium]